MKKRTILPLYISSIIGGIILILTVVGLFIDKTKNYYPFLLLILCSIGIIVSGILSYFIHDLASGILNAITTFLAYVGLRMLYVSPIDISIMPVWMIIIILILLSLNFISIILSVYRLPINQTKFDNKLFGELRDNQKTSFLLTLVNVVLLIIIITSLSLNEINMPITITAGIISIIYLLFGKTLTLIFKQRIGSLFILIVPIIIIFGTNPKEFSLDNTCILLMLLEYILCISLSIVEYTKVEVGEETKIGPKEYKK